MILHLMPLLLICIKMSSLTMRGYHLPTSAIRWQQDSQICFATFILWKIMDHGLSEQKCIFEHYRKIKIINKLYNYIIWCFKIVLFTFSELPSMNSLWHYMKICHGIGSKKLKLLKYKLEFETFQNLILN